MFKWDPTISLGTVILLVGMLLSLISIVAVVVRAYVNLASRMDKLETRMDPVWNWFLAELKELRVTQVAVERQTHGTGGL